MGKIKFNLEFGGFYNSLHENIIDDAISNMFQDYIDFDSFNYFYKIFVFNIATFEEKLKFILKFILLLL